MEQYIFEIIMFIVSVLFAIIGFFVVSKLNSIHDDIKGLQTKDVCREKHENNAQEHESIRKDIERHEIDIRELKLT